MKIGNKKISWNKNIVTISLCALFLVIIGGVSYAYFTASIFGNDTAKDVQAYAGTMSLRLYGNTAVGMSSALPGDSTTITFSVENTGTLSTSYEIDMIDVINDFAKPEELVYTLSSTNGGAIQEETMVPLENTTIIPAAGIDPGVTQEYTLTITFKETGSPQNYNQGKTFSGKIQINNLENSSYLAGRIMARAINFGNVDFSLPVPKEKYKMQVSFNNEMAYSSSIRGDKKIGNSIRFNKDTGKYQLIDIELNASYDENSIDKYVCANIIDENNECYSVYKIKKISKYSNENGINYEEKLRENFSTNLSDNYKYVAQSYTFDPEKGLFTLVSPIEKASFSDEYLDYYTCLSTRKDNKCTLLYQIKEVTDGKVTKTNRHSATMVYTEGVDNNIEEFMSDLINTPITVGKNYSFDNKDGSGTFTITDIEENVIISDQYVGYYTTFSSDVSSSDIYRIRKIENDIVYLDYIYSIDPSYVMKAAEYYTSTGDLEESDSGLYEAEDDLGMSYYFRGNITNNYVKFANYIWRVYRINGDGSIRLIKNSFMNNTNNNEAAFSVSDDDPKYVGYTYDNSVPNIQDGTNSAIKTYLENWYDSNSYIKANQDKIVTGIYCNDTSGDENESGNIIYGTKTRIEHAKPTLKCPTTNKTYGGKYELKIGLPSADEILMAGFTEGVNANNNNIYLYAYNGSWLTMSPYEYLDNQTHIYVPYYDRLQSRPSAQETKVRPVINLRKDIKFTSGNGTKDNPYVIE